MANYYTQFSAALQLDDAAMAQRAKAFFEEWCGFRGEDAQPGFELRLIDSDTGLEDKSVLLMYSEESGEPGDVVEFVRNLGKVLGLQDRWGFAWANTCNKFRPDSFSGGAVFIDFDGDRAEWLNTSTWLEQNGVTVA